MSNGQPRRGRRKRRCIASSVVPEAMWWLARKGAPCTSDSDDLVSLPLINDRRRGDHRPLQVRSSSVAYSVVSETMLQQFLIITYTAENTHRRRKRQRDLEAKEATCKNTRTVYIADRR